MPGHAQGGEIAGLILEAVQINQNTQITKEQIANDYFLADMALELAYTQACAQIDTLLASY